MPRIFVVLLLAFEALAQAPVAPTIAVTPAMVSITSGTSLYCALRPLTAPQYQLYCYTTGVTTCVLDPATGKIASCATATTLGKVWDNLIYNALISVPNVPTSQQGLSYAVHSAGSPNGSQATWMLYKSVTALQWQVVIDGVVKTGTITSGGFVAE